MKKRLLSTFLCLCMALTLLPAPAGAAEGATISVDGTSKTLAVAISEANAGDTLQLTASFTQPRNNGVTISKDLTLDLNGQTITYNGLNSSLITVSGCTLTVTDSGTDGAIEAMEANYVFYLEELGKLVVNGGTLSSPNGSSLIWNASNGKITINGGTVSASGRSYGTIFSGSGSRGTIAVTSGTVQATGEDGRAIGSDSGAVTVSGGTVEATGNNGKAIDKSSTTGTITVSGGIVRATTGPAIYQRSYGPIVIKGGTVTSANTGATSGTIYFATAPRNPQTMLTITDGTVENTASPDEGYSVYFGRDPYMGGEVTSETLYGYYSHTGGTVGKVYPEPPPHTHAVSVDCSASEGTQVTFTALGDTATLTAGSYYLDADRELTAPLAVPDGVAVDLCLNGHALTYVGTDDTHSVITVGDGATLNLCDCDGSGGSHTFTSPVTGEAVTIQGGLITGAHRVAAGAAREGGAIYSKGDVNLYGGAIAGNTGYYGGGVYLNGKNKTADLTFTMYGGQICHNESTNGGGGVYLYPCANDPANAGFVLHGGEIHHNKANGTGGGVGTNGTRTSVLMDGGSIHHNTAGGRGGGLYLYGRTTSLLGGSIHHNTTESAAAGGVYPGGSSGAVVTLGGDMTITDNTAAGGAASNLHVWFELTVQDGFTGQVGMHTDDDYYLGRPFLQDAAGASLESKLGQFLPDVPGQFTELLTGENAGKLTLSRIAITTQPTAEAPAVGVNYAPQGISYQWYTAQRRGETVTDRNAAPYEDIHPTSARSSRPIASFDETSGTWTSSQYRQGDNGGYFEIGMKAGDALTVTIPADQMPQMPEGQTWALTLCNDEYEDLSACFDPSETNSEGVTVTTGADGAATVTYLVPADGEYTLMAHNLFYYDEEDNYVDLSAPVISAVWTHVVPVDEVTGQTAATLSATAPGSYLCRVTWPDGTELNSRPVTFAPPVTHTHAVSVDCETEGENLVTFKALTSQDEKLYIDGEAAEASSTYKAYMLPEGSYYLDGDVVLNKTLRTAGNVDLCLNGYKLQYWGTENKSVILVGNTRYVLNICDCNPTGKDRTANVIDDPVSGYTKDIWGGVITGGKRSGIEHSGTQPVTLYGGTIAGNDSSAGTSRYGGGVYANHVVMHGGTILYNKAYQGGGVFAIKSFTMTGGEINNNWADAAGGVWLGDSATATLSGNAVISDNEAGTAKAPSNLCLGTGRTVTVAPEGLGQNAGVGVTTSTAPTDASPVTVAVAGEGDALTADDLAKFSSDNSDYALKLSEGSIVLAKPAPYAITTQPTVANGYTVTASHPEKAHYQWYRSGDSNGIGAKIAQEGAAFGSAAEGANYDGSNGHWSGTAKNGVCEFFTLNLKAGQLVYLGFESGYRGKTFTLTGDNGQTVTATPAVGYLYLPVPADGRYTLRISGLIGSYATLFSASLYPPLAGQTGAALVPAKGGSHFCLVTWDGTEQYERSDSVTPVIATTALTLEPETLALQVGQTETLDVTRTPGDANDDITWASDNEGVATVDDWGEVEAVSAGTATITATANGITASCAVTVTPVPVITQQPKAENKYTVGVNYAPEGISYQWYPATVTTADITPENADPFTEDGDPANFADGKWTVAEGDWYDGYFTTALKKGDVVAVTMTTAEKPNEGVLGLIYENDDHGESYHLGYYFSDFEPDEGVTAAEKDGSTVITYVIPADGSYDLVFSGGAAPAISAKLTHTQLGEAVSGQTTAQLTAAQAGTYLCRVTWPDGTVLDSDVVAYVPLDPGESKGEVEVKGDTPPVTVDEDALKDLAGEVSNGDIVTVKLTVEKQDSPADKDALEAIISGKKNDVLYLDLSLLKQVNDGTPQPITDTEGAVLEIAVDYDFTGKKDVTVYRKHGEEPAAALTRLTARPTENYTEGSFFADSANGKVYIYAGKFSTYAIGYTARSTTPSRPSRPSRPAWPFTDVKTTDDCYEAVKYVYERGWMLGTSDTTFDPNGPLTRAMLATVLYRSAGSPKVEGAPEFRDTEAETWYSDAVRWAVEAKILRGYGNGSFGPNDPVSKEMLNMVMGRLQGQDPAWVGDNALAVPATRAEIAAMLMRYRQGEQ